MGFRDWFKGSAPVATHDDAVDAMSYFGINKQPQSLDYADPNGMPEWYNGPNTAWRATISLAQMQQQAIQSAYPYNDWATRGLVNWNIGSNSTQPLPQMGDVLTTDGIMAIVRHEMEKGAGKAVVKCQHCGMWAARFCACGKCGAPVD